MKEKKYVVWGYDMRVVHEALVSGEGGGLGIKYFPQAFERRRACYAIPRRIRAIRAKESGSGGGEMDLVLV